MESPVVFRVLTVNTFCLVHSSELRNIADWYARSDFSSLRRAFDEQAFITFVLIQVAITVPPLQM